MIKVSSLSLSFFSIDFITASLCEVVSFLLILVWLIEFINGCKTRSKIIWLNHHFLVIYYYYNFLFQRFPFRSIVFVPGLKRKE